MRAPLTLAAALLCAAAASAQLSALGSPTSVGAASGTGPVRWPDIAYDPANDVYLGVSGAVSIQGQYWSGTGVPLGQPFTVPANAILYGQAPRVAYASGSGAFLVAWHETLPGDTTRIRGRLLRYGQAALTGDFDVSSLGTNHEMGAAMAYSPQSREFLVSWQGPGTSLRAQRLSDTGVQVGPELDLDPGSRYHRDPAVGYEPTSGEYLVAFAGCVATHSCFVEAQRVKAGTGALVGGRIILDDGVTATYTPEVAFNTITQKWLVVWQRLASSIASFHSRRIAPGGALDGPALQVTVLYTSYDANGLAWNPLSNTFLFVTHGNDSQDVAIELSANGAPLDTTGTFFGPVNGNGNFNPRVCASSARAEWLAITSTAMASLTAQRMITLTRDSTGVIADAGAPDSGLPDSGLLDAGTHQDGGPEPLPDAGISSDGGWPGSIPDGGGVPGRVEGAPSCGCSPGAGSPAGSFWLLLTGAAFGLRRRPAI